MKKFNLGVIVCAISILVMVLGCSAYEHPATSVERLRELIAEAEARNKPGDISPPTYKQQSSTQLALEQETDVQATEYDRDYLGYVPPDYYGDLTEAEQLGLQTWYFWTGGNEKFFRDLAKQTHGEADFLSLLDARPESDTVDGTHHYQRNERFKEIGAINDPSCTAATEPDEYGLWLDKCDQDPNAAGIMGARKFPNPNFDPEKWDAVEYYAKTANQAQIEPPYRVGISCGVCHIAFNPLKPPQDPENPQWSNIASAIGNQYLREGRLFGGTIPDEDFRKQVLNSQPPGTSDTSRIATDHIDNPNTINAIFNLADRPRAEEVMNDGTKQKVPHILKDGADSVGIPLASERVYINIGSCSDYWLTLHEPLLGTKEQKPFEIETARKECEYWPKTAARMANAEAFLTTLTPMHLEDAPGGKAYLTKDNSVLNQGKIAFADTCASCHSSKQPSAEILADPEQAKQWYRESVLSSDFLEHNFLSDDKRYPITQIGTNAARALGTNAKEGQVWAQFSSKTYKDLPSPGKLNLENPFDPDKPIEFDIPAGGTGYYRTPSLISVWSSAPLLHNNQLGEYNADPSVAGRMTAFNDGMEKLLWPEKRDGIIHRTERDTHLAMGELEADVPKGTPIKLLANLDPRETPGILQRKLNSELGGKILSSLVRFIPDEVLTPLLLNNNRAPDFIEDHGHEFGTNLADDDKRALIEFLKTF